MCREEYIKELRMRLAGLPQAEIEDAVSYCEEYFQEAEDEHKVMEGLGTPAKFAAQIKAESAIRVSENPNNFRRPHSMMKSFFMIFGGICALPIALPLLMVVIILIFILALVIGILLFTGFIIGAAFIVAAIISMVRGFFYFGAPGDMIVHMGISLIFFGVGILGCLLVYTMVRSVVPWFMNKISSFYHRHKKGAGNYA